MRGTHPGVTSCPSIYYQVTAEDRHHLLLLRPFSLPTLPPPSASLRPCLIYPFRSAKSLEMRGICCNALWRCAALHGYVSGQGLVCMRRRRERTANRWWGRTCVAGSLINKIYYGNAADEMRRCDLSHGCNRRKRSCNHKRAYSHLHGGTFT